MMIDLKNSLPDTVACPTLTNLSVESTVGDLLLHHISLPLTAMGKEVMALFTEDPVLPGIILLENDKFVGMISRQRFLTQMSRPYSLELFLERPLHILYPFIRNAPLVLSSDVPIVEAAQRSLQRPTHLLYEPIVVETSDQQRSILDIHQLLIAQAEIHRLTTQMLHEKTQAHLTQSEKMSSLGRMIAGVSHEIKNPVNCISGNFEFLNRYIHDLLSLLKTYREFYQATSAIGLEDLSQHRPNVSSDPTSTEVSPAASSSFQVAHSDFTFILADDVDGVEAIEAAQPKQSSDLQSQREAIAQLEENIELDFLLTDLPKLMQSVSLAAERMVEIVSSLRNFSRMDQEQPQLIDIHKYLDGTLLILNNRLKVGIDLIRDYEDVPLIQCYPGQISQVFMNLISNSVDALLDKQKQHKSRPIHFHSSMSVGAAPDGLAPMLNPLLESPSHDDFWQPCIRISTHYLQHSDQDYLQIKIWDNGDGMPQDVRERVFDAFFTTKSIDQGTGLGLAISHQIVTQKHGGHINVTSSPEEGTEFEILLPYIQQS